MNMQTLVVELSKLRAEIDGPVTPPDKARVMAQILGAMITASEAQLEYQRLRAQHPDVWHEAFESEDDELSEADAEDIRKARVIHDEIQHRLNAH